MTIENILKGDIVYYRNGHINRVNKPDRYMTHYTKDLKNKHDPHYDIVKVQRYVKFLGLYRLRTIFRR